jgi:hypothetical protein
MLFDGVDNVLDLLDSAVANAARIEERLVFDP